MNGISFAGRDPNISRDRSSESFQYVFLVADGSGNLITGGRGNGRRRETP
jgi:hypothetical protein